MNLIQNQLQKMNNNRQMMIPLPERIKLLLPTTIDKARAYRDGPPLLSKVQKYYYETFPSMVTNDVKCNQRIKNKPKCHGRTIARIRDKFEAYGIVQNTNNKHSGRPRTSTSPGKELQVQETLLRSPQKSLRQTAQETHIS